MDFWLFMSQIYLDRWVAASISKLSLHVPPHQIHKALAFLCLEPSVISQDLQAEYLLFYNTSRKHPEDKRGDLKLSSVLLLQLVCSFWSQ